jgi:hypothetical protein
MSQREVAAYQQIGCEHMGTVVLANFAAVNTSEIKTS